MIIYYSAGTTQYVLTLGTTTWTTKTWTGLTNFYGVYIWSDGTYVYYSTDGGTNYYLSGASTWTTKTWNGLSVFDGGRVWTDGNNIYYSNGSQQFVLDKKTSTWNAKTWSGISTPAADYIWSDGESIYYSTPGSQYVLDVATSTWKPIVWGGETVYLQGKYRIWYDGTDVWYIYGSYGISTTTEYYKLAKSKIIKQLDKPDLQNMESKLNKVTSLSSASTNEQYPSAKCVYDLVGDIDTILTTLNSGSGV